MISIEQITEKGLETAYKWSWFKRCREERARLLIEAAKIRVNEGEKLLEIGTGKGDMCRLLSNQSKGKVFSLDIKDQMVNIQDSLGSGFGGRVTADGSIIPFETGNETDGFDVVTICLVLHHLSNVKVPEVVSEALRVTKEGGRVVIMEDDIDEPLWKSSKLKDRYVRAVDVILNMGVPGGGEAGQKTVAEWEETFSKCGAQQMIKMGKKELPVFGILPWQVNVFELKKVRNINPKAGGKRVIEWENEIAAGGW